MSQETYERIPAYSDNNSIFGADPFTDFKTTTGNQEFRQSFLTWFNLFILLVAYPAVSLMGGGEEALDMLKGLTPGALKFMLIATVLFQWMIYSVNWGALKLEGTDLAGIGLTRIKLVDFAWAGAFLLVANLILAGLAWIMAQIGMPLHGEVGLLIPTDPAGKVIWVLVSFTAGFCEEVAFRGYLMTRLRLLGRFKSWIIPTLIAAFSFGACHAYQGWPGFILITIYGLMFAAMYIRTGRLWPCILAHFAHDFGALIWPQ